MNRRHGHGEMLDNLEEDDLRISVLEKKVADLAETVRFLLSLVGEKNLTVPVLKKYARLIDLLEVKI